MHHQPGRRQAPDPTTLLSVTARPPARPGHVVVEVAGAVDTYTAPLLDACLGTQTRRRGVRELTVDMGRVTFLGAAGVCVLAQARRRCRMRGARLVVVCDDRPGVRRPIGLCGLGDLLPPEPGDPGGPEDRAARAPSPLPADRGRAATRRLRDVRR